MPFVRFEAAGGVWRWYYWQVDKPEMRRSTLEALATRMNTETDAMVRRGLQESIYDLLDENTGYLSAWVRASAKDEDKDRIDAGYEAVVRDQAQVLAKVLREGTPLGREGILNALWDFHIRHYALPTLKADTVSIGLPAVLTKYVTGVPDLHRPGYEYPPYREAVDFKYDVHNGFFQTRIGNDSDLIHFFKSSGPELEEALLACLKDADDTMKIEVLKAGSTLSEAGDARFTLAALNLSEDPNPEVRQTVRYVYEDGQRGVLNLDYAGSARSTLVGKVVEILKHGNPDSQAVVLPLLAALAGDSAWDQQTEVQGRAAVDARSKNRGPQLRAGAGRGLLLQQPDARTRAAEASARWVELLEPRRSSAPRCAFAFEHFLDDPADRACSQDRVRQSERSPRCSILLEEAGNPQFLKRRLGVVGRSRLAGSGLSEPPCSAS